MPSLFTQHIQLKKLYNRTSYLMKALLAMISACESLTAVPSSFKCALKMHRLPGNHHNTLFSAQHACAPTQVMQNKNSTSS